MEARDEQADLKANPLPELPIPDPLTRVHDLDKQIATLQEQIQDMLAQRTEALDYAIRHQINEDAQCRLEQKIKRFRTLDPARFRDVFPDVYMTVCDAERRELEERMKEIGKKIPITLVDKLVKKAALEASGAVTVKETVSYQVVPR